MASTRTDWGVALVGWIVAWHGTAVQTALPAADPLIVRIYDRAGRPPNELDAAKATARAILWDARIELRWRDCSSTAACGEALAPAELVVRILPSPPESEPEWLGYSLVDTERRSGSLATIFDDRVAELARTAEVEPGGLLGRAIAHEIGHLLLGTLRHATHGLMRGRWSVVELRRNRRWDWTWTGPEETALRRALRERDDVIDGAGGKASSLVP